MCAECSLAVITQAYAKLRTDTPELLDLVAQFAGQDLTDDPMAVDDSSSAPVANSGEQYYGHQMHCPNTLLLWNLNVAYIVESPNCMLALPHVAESF